MTGRRDGEKPVSLPQTFPFPVSISEPRVVFLRWQSRKEEFPCSIA